jgi:hypothetical protein
MLGEKERNALLAMTPKLEKLYQVEGTWQHIVESVMHLPSDINQRVASIWIENVARFEAAGLRADPQQFAEKFVDENFGTTSPNSP